MLTDDICMGEMSKIVVENRALSVYVVNDKGDEKLIIEISKSICKNIKVWYTVGNRKKLTPKRASKAKDFLSKSSGPHNINIKPNNPHQSDIYVRVGNPYIPLHTQTYLLNQI